MSKETVLIVEDESIAGMDLQLMLERWGYETTGIATTGEEAVRKVEQHRPDVILMDINIDGDMDGLEVAGMIRSEWGTPVIFMTGYSDEDLIGRASAVGPSAILIKPLDTAALHAAVKAAIKRS